MVSGPDGMLVFHHMEDVFPALCLPALVFLGQDIIDHVGETAFSAASAGYFFGMVHFQEIAQKPGQRNRDLKNKSSLFPAA